MILLTPGPANTTQTVKDALVVDDICHREKAFADVLAELRGALLQLADVEDSHDVVFFTGSGSCAVDAAMASAVPPDGKLLLVVNGSYGVRMRQMAVIYGIEHEVIEWPWHEPVSASAIAARLTDGTRFTHLAVVHHETSTGVLNPLEEIANLCSQHDVRLIVDAISSFAGIPVDVGPIDFMMASSNKCLQGMPGLGMVFVRRDLFDAISQFPPRSFYTGLAAEWRAAKKNGQMRFTPAVQVIYALAQAVKETFEETLAARFKRYRSNWKAMRKGMIAQGFHALIENEAHESGLLSSYLKPKHAAYDFDRHHDLLFDAGFTIYPAMSGYEHTFRLGNIGEIRVPEIEAFLEANAEVMQAMGVTGG